MKRHVRAACIAGILVLTGSVAVATDLPDWAALWNNWPAEWKNTYLIGLSDGLMQAYARTHRSSGKGSLRTPAKVPDSFWIQDTKAVATEMSQLYRDHPHLRCVVFAEVAMSARDKLNGKDLGPWLRATREVGATYGASVVNPKDGSVTFEQRKCSDN